MSSDEPLQKKRKTSPAAIETSEQIIKKRKSIRVPDEEDYAHLLNTWAQLPSKEIAFEVTEMVNEIEDMYEEDDEEPERESLTLLKRCFQVGLLDALVLPKVKAIIKAEEDRDLSALEAFLETL